MSDLREESNATWSNTSTSPSLRRSKSFGNLTTTSPTVSCDDLLKSVSQILSLL